MQKSCACNFLYGQKTDPQHREAISRALEQKKELKLEMILYKSSGELRREAALLISMIIMSLIPTAPLLAPNDTLGRNWTPGTPFWCLLDIVPIQDEKHEVVLFLCSHKDITKQKLHEQQQHQLAQLHAQKQQQQLLSAAAAAAAAAHEQHSSAGGQGANQAGLTNHDQQQQQQQQELADHEDSSLLSGRRRHVAAHEADGSSLHSGGEQLLPAAAAAAARKLEDADEAELAAMANQNALLSMDEFGLQDDSGAEGADFDEGASDSGDDHDKHTASQYSRRRSRAVLYQLSGHYGYRRSVNMKSKLKLNNVSEIKSPRARRPAAGLSGQSG